MKPGKVSEISEEKNQGLAEDHLASLISGITTLLLWNTIIKTLYVIVMPGEGSDYMRLMDAGTSSNIASNLAKGEPPSFLAHAYNNHYQLCKGGRCRTTVKAPHYCKIGPIRNGGQA